MDNLKSQTNFGHSTSASIPVSNIIEMLHKYAKSEASQKCGGEYGRPVDPVEFVLAKYTGGLVPDETDPKERRKKLAHLFDEDSGPKCNITIKNMFKQAKIEAEERLNDRKISEADLDKYSKSIAVVGVVGVGKSTLTKVVLKHILDKTCLNNTSFVFYIKISSINLEERTDLYTFLFFPLIANLSLVLNKLEIETLIKLVLEDHNAIVIIDGLDEVGTANLKKDYKPVLPHSTALPMVFLFNILNGFLLPYAYKLVTSRKTEFLDARPEYRPKFVVEILGLGSKAQKELAMHVCGEQYEDVQAIIHNNCSLLESCGVPVKMLMILNYLLLKLKSGDRSSDPITLTGVYVAMLNKYIRSKHCIFPDDVDAVKKLADLAWFGFYNKKAIFTDHDIRNYGIPLSAQQSFVDTNVESDENLTMVIRRQDKISFFVHRSWQELLVALRLVLFMPLDKFKSYLKDSFESGDLENVLTFCFGLCKESVFNQAIKLCHSVESIQTHKKIFLGVIAHNKSKKLKTNGTLNSWFHLFECLNELKSNEITAPVVKLLPKAVKINGLTFSSDISNSFALFELTACFPQFNTVCLPVIGGVLQTLGEFVAKYKIKIPTLLFKEWNDEQAPHLEKCIPYVDACKISTNENTTEILNTAKCINNALSRSGKFHMLTRLNLRCNLGNEGLNVLAESLEYIEALSIQKCSVTNVDMLALIIKKLKKPMKDLALMGNNIGNTGVEKLAMCLFNIQELDLGNCGITFDVIPSFTSALLALQEPINKLGLNENHIGDDGMIELVKGLHKIKTLKASKCGVTCIGLQALARRLYTLQNPLEGLYVKHNVEDKETQKLFEEVRGKVKRWL